MNKLKNILGLAAGLVLAIGPYTFLHVCGANMKMGSEMGDMGSMAGGPPCHGIPTASLVTGIVLILISIISLITETKSEAKNSGFESILDLVRIILGVIAVGIPTFIIGVCQSAHMHCHMVTRPALILIGVIVGLTGILSLGLKLVSNGTEEDSLQEQAASEA